MSKITDGLKKLTGKLGATVELDKKAVENTRLSNQAAARASKLVQAEKVQPRRYQ